MSSRLSRVPAKHRFRWARRPGECRSIGRPRHRRERRRSALQRAGGYPPPAGAPADIPGLECAGETETGERLMALLPGGGHAELVTVHESHTLQVPEHVSWPEAGGFVEAFATAHDAVFTQAQLQPGERLLVNGAAGGVGVAAVQLGVAVRRERHRHRASPPGRAAGARRRDDAERRVRRDPRSSSAAPTCRPTSSGWQCTGGSP